MLLMSCMIFLIISTPVSANGTTVTRIMGDNRFATSVEVSKQGWPNGSAKIVLAVGDNFPDALAGAPLAYDLNAPILLTKKASLPYEVSIEIKRLNVKEAIILGGPNVISDGVLKELHNMGIKTERVAGKDRFETTVKIANRLSVKSDIAVVAYAGNFPDSLSVASVAAQNKYPIFLVSKDNIPDSVKEALKGYKRTFVIGGDKVVTNQVMNQLPNPVRVAGSDRFDTAAKVVDTFGQTTAKTAVVATGKQFADALTGSVLAAKQKSPVLLVDHKAVPTSVSNMIAKSNFQQFSIIGGTGAVADNVPGLLKFNVTAMLKTADSLKGIPYLWGGTTPRGFDCSGFITYVFKNHGISLPRTVSDMWNYGAKVSQPQPGDLVFFETYKKGPSHAGIYIGNNQFIHSANSGVEVSNLSNSYYKARYLGAKKVIK